MEPEVSVLDDKGDSGHALPDLYPMLLCEETQTRLQIQNTQGALASQQSARPAQVHHEAAHADDCSVEHFDRALGLLRE